MKARQSRSSASRSVPKARWKARKTRSPRAVGAIGLAAIVRAAQEVEECQELARVPGAQVIDQGPGLRIEVALIAAAEAGVSDQALEANRVLNLAASRGAAGRGRG